MTRIYGRRRLARSLWNSMDNGLHQIYFFRTHMVQKSRSHDNHMILSLELELEGINSDHSITRSSCL